MHGEYVLEEYHDFKDLAPLELKPEQVERSYAPKIGVFTEDNQTLGRYVCIFHVTDMISITFIIYFNISGSTTQETI